MALTKAQENFIFSKDKFIRLLAPAGCGKTFSIMEKTKAILNDNRKAKINIFTFTRNASKEIIDRCGGGDTLTVNTLNSWGNSYVKTTVLKNAKLISSAQDRKFCMGNYLQPVWGKPEHDIFRKLCQGRSRVRCGEKLLDLIDNFKNLGFKHTEFMQDAEHTKDVYVKHMNFINKVGLMRYYDSVCSELINMLPVEDRLQILIGEDMHAFLVEHWIPFWRDCCVQMIESGIYTLDDQKYFANIELEKRVLKNERWTGAAKIDYIFVDEFQDTNPLDLMLISNLQKLTDAGLIIVGDDDQAIFEFRGAAPYFILHPNEIFGHKFVTFCLDKNFRSPANIVQKSQILISHNKNRVDKSVSAESNRPLAKIEHINTNNQALVSKVIDVVKHTLQQTNENIVIVSRLKASLLPYQVLLTKDNIDYSVSDDLAFFYTNAAQNLNKVLDIKRANKPLGARDLLELVCLYSKNEIYKSARDTLWHALMLNNATLENIHEILWNLGRSKQNFEKLLTKDFIDGFEHAVDNFEKAESVYDTLSCLLGEFDGLKKNYSRSLEDLYYKDPPLASLLDFAQQYGNDFDGFYDDFNRAITKTVYAKEIPDVLLDKSQPRIILSTALRVKGQEFDNVIILNANDGVWPKLTKTQQTTRKMDMESERRLFYVAVTRVKNVLYFAEDKAPQSPFIAEGEFL